MTNNKSPAKKIRSYKRLITFILSKSSKNSPVLTVCVQHSNNFSPFSQILSVSRLPPINISPKQKTLLFSKPNIFEITPFSNTPEISPLDISLILSKLQEMQITVVQIQQDHQEQVKLKDEEIGIYRTVLSTIGVPLPNC